ncbi:hypothetical protein ACLOJK_036671, partial [Asimina triloba]
GDVAAVSLCDGDAVCDGDTELPVALLPAHRKEMPAARCCWGPKPEARATGIWKPIAIAGYYFAGSESCCCDEEVTDWKGVGLSIILRPWLPGSEKFVRFVTAG